MLEQYKYVFKIIIMLSEERAKCINQDTVGDSVINSSEVNENYEYSKYSRLLLDFSESLEYETIKVVQTVMYLRRDKDYNETLEKDNIYDAVRKYMDNKIGWSTKGQEIFQMIEKFFWGQYLTDGIKILEIEI